MRTKWGVVAMLVGVATTAMAIGDDSSSLRSDLADYQARGASLESSRYASGCSSCGGGVAAASCSVCGGSTACEADARSLASMKNSACITIGGQVDVPLFYTNRQRGPVGILGIPVRYSNTYFSGEAALYIDANATQDAKLRLKLDLEDAFDGHHMDDLLEEVYFQWTNIACSGLGVAFGKKTVDFGQHRSIGYLKPLTAGRAQLFRNPADKYTGAVANEFVDFYMVGQNLGLPGEVTDQFQIEASYAFADIAKLTVATFQNTADEGNNNPALFGHLGARTSGGRGTVGRTYGPSLPVDRTRDPLFRSYAVKAEVTPFEGLNANISYISMYDREFGGTNANTTRNARALSVGVDYQLCVLPLEIFAEYLHGWNWNHIFTNDTDTYQGGLIWGVTDSIDLGLMIEHARVNYPGAGTEKVWNYYTTAYYKMTGNVKVGVEFMYQRVRDPALIAWNVGVGSPTRNAYALGFVTRMTF